MCLPVSVNISRRELQRISEKRCGATFIIERFFGFEHKVLAKVPRDDGLLIVVERLSDTPIIRGIHLLYYPKFGGGGFVDETKVPSTLDFLAPYKAIFEVDEAERKRIAEQKLREDAIELGQNFLPEQAEHIVAGMSQDAIEAFRIAWEK